MFLFVVPILLLASSVQSHNPGFYLPRESAASEAQIRFAIENKYDDTGPGAKGPEFAYATFNNLDDALIGYIDDPDTKLSEHDKARGLQRLYQNQYNERGHIKLESGELIQQTPLSRTFSLLREKPDIPTLISPEDLKAKFRLELPVKPEDLKAKFSQELPIASENLRKKFRSEVPKIKTEQFRLHSFRPVKGSPVNLAHFLRVPAEETNVLSSNPSYSYSYGVHDKMTGDSKSAHETREGDKVTGFYTFLDPDGKQRTVHYTADDKDGFRAVVRRTVTNSQ